MVALPVVSARAVAAAAVSVAVGPSPVASAAVGPPAIVSVATLVPARPVIAASLVQHGRLRRGYRARGPDRRAGQDPDEQDERSVAPHGCLPAAADGAYRCLPQRGSSGAPPLTAVGRQSTRGVLV